MKFFAVVMVVLLCISTDPVSAIKCFQCNSVNNSACTNLEGYGKYRDFLIPTTCPSEFGTAKAFCRKTVLQVIDKTRYVEERVIRNCGWIPHKRECYNTDNEGHQERVCQCFEDGCNHAGLNKPSMYNAMFATILLFIVTFYYI